MKRRVLGLCVAVLFAGMSVFGQNNARIQGLANTDITPDINRVIYVNPAFMSDYKNNLQVSFNSPMIGIVKANDVISLGAVLNNGLVLKGFYGTAYGALPDINPALPPPPAAPNAGIQYFPHILFGLDLSAVRLGFDLFWEHARYTSETKTAAGTTTITQSVNDYGVIAGADFKLGELGLSLDFGVGFPGIYYKIVVPAVPPAPTVTTDLESDKGLFLKGGAEARMTLISLDWTLGLDFMRENFRFVDKTAIAPANGLGPDVSVVTITPYIGFKKEILDKVLLVAEEKSALQYVSIESPPPSPPSLKNGTHQFVHTLSLGLEKMFQKVWIFDELGGRGGISWSITNTSTWTNNTAIVAPGPPPTTTNTTTDVGPVEVLGPAQPYVGFGATKGAFTCDVVVNPANWGGVLIGPPVARVTAGLKF
jgi:hypothetical protein